MVFEPLPAFDIDGLGVYADAPEVRDRVDRGSLAGTRVDRITVVFERPGSYVLPGLEFAWWDPAREELKRRTVEPLAVEVAENPAWAGAAPAAEAEGYAFRWTDTLWIVAVAVLLDGEPLHFHAEGALHVEPGHHGEDEEPDQPVNAEPRHRKLA